MAKRKIAAAVMCLPLAAAVLVISACAEIVGAEAPRRDIMKPYISVQPKSASYHVVDTDIVETLEFKIWDWKAEDGSLSYQWFKFDSDTIGNYFTAGRGAPETANPVDIDMDRDMDNDGTITIFHKLTGLIPTADKQYFYYVVVTNTNPEAGNAAEASVQSEIAAISFSAAGKPLYPIIVRNPVSAAYGWGDTLNTLRVEARLAGITGALSYQWYISASNTNKTGRAKTDETQSFHMPDYDDLDLDNNFYFVTVTNTEGADTAVARSFPALINMEPGLRAAVPVITLQPKDSLYFNGEKIGALSVAGTSPDKGTISYQWYSNTAAAGKGGKAISGATGASFTPSVTDNSTQFFYAVVTNTNTRVKGTTAATAASNAVRVSVAAAAGSNPTVNLFMRIPDPKQSTNRFQYIRGYGGMDVAWGNFPRTSQADTELMYDPDKLGYNILRIMIKADYVDPAETINMLLNSDRPDYFENVKIVNKYGGYVQASPWTPPKDWKSNNSINGGGYLIPRYYPLFAQYLRNFAQFMYDNGAPIYCISISNEPNYVAGYDGCEWTPEQMRDFFLQEGRFTEGVRGWGGGREIPTVLTMNGESANTPYINNAALIEPKSKAAIDLLARHIYGSRTESLWNSNPANITKINDENEINKGRMEVWMTEHNINSANATGYYNDSTWNYVWRFMNDVDLSMRLNNENAFVWWASKRFYSMVGDGQFGTTDGSALPRGYGLSHYARYTTGMTRIRINLDTVSGQSQLRDGNVIDIAETGASLLNSTVDNMDNESVRITAYTSRDFKEISLVMWTPTKTGSGGFNVGTIRVEMPPGFKANGVKAVRSSGALASQIFQPIDVQLNSSRNLAYITLLKSQIVSVKFTGEWEQ